MFICVLFQDILVKKIKCRLGNALYSLRQAPQAWFAKCHSIITELDFYSSYHDSTLFTQKQTMVLLSCFFMLMA